MAVPNINIREFAEQGYIVARGLFAPGRGQAIARSFLAHQSRAVHCCGQNR